MTAEGRGKRPTLNAQRATPNAEVGSQKKFERRKSIFGLQFAAVAAGYETDPIVKGDTVVI